MYRPEWQVACTPVTPHERYTGVPANSLCQVMYHKKTWDQLQIHDGMYVRIHAPFDDLWLPLPLAAPSCDLPPATRYGILHTYRHPLPYR